MKGPPSAVRPRKGITSTSTVELVEATTTGAALKSTSTSTQPVPGQGAVAVAAAAASSCTTAPGRRSTTILTSDSMWNAAEKMNWRGNAILRSVDDAGDRDRARRWQKGRRTIAWRP